MTKIFECEYTPGEEVVLHFRFPEIKSFPSEARDHFRTARKEVLLALRSLLDACIEERAEKRGGKKRTKIQVE